MDRSRSFEKWEAKESMSAVDMENIGDNPFGGAAYTRSHRSVGYRSCGQSEDRVLSKKRKGSFTDFFVAWEVSAATTDKKNEGCVYC
jgi:transposase-like protein